MIVVPRVNKRSCSYQVWSACGFKLHEYYLGAIVSMFNSGDFVGFITFIATSSCHHLNKPICEISRIHRHESSIGVDGEHEPLTSSPISHQQ